MVEIPESYILFLLGAVFVPLFIFLIKMIIEQGTLKSKFDLYDKHLEETRPYHTTLELIKQRLEAIENDIKELFRRVGYRRNEYYDKSNQGDYHNHYEDEDTRNKNKGKGGPF